MTIDQHIQRHKELINSFSPSKIEEAKKEIGALSTTIAKFITDNEVIPHQAEILDLTHQLHRLVYAQQIARIEKFLNK